jgi:hypothetical protein
VSYVEIIPDALPADLTLVTSERPACNMQMDKSPTPCGMEAVSRAVYEHPCPRHPERFCCIYHRDRTITNRLEGRGFYCYPCGPRVLLGVVVRFEPL